MWNRGAFDIWTNLLELFLHGVAERNNPALPFNKISGERDVEEMFFVRNNVVRDGHRAEFSAFSIALLLKQFCSLGANSSKRRGEVAHPVSCQEDIRTEGCDGSSGGFVSQRIGGVQDSLAFYRQSRVFRGYFLCLAWKQETGILPFEVERLYGVLFGKLLQQVGVELRYPSPERVKARKYCNPHRRLLCLCFLCLGFGFSLGGNGLFLVLYILLVEAFDDVIGDVQIRVSLEYSGKDEGVFLLFVVLLYESLYGIHYLVHHNSVFLLDFSLFLCAEILEVCLAVTSTRFFSSASDWVMSPFCILFWKSFMSLSKALPFA